MTLADVPAAQRADLSFAIEAARSAGERVLALRATGRWTQEPTLADIGDQAADGFLQGFVRGRYPQDGILSEETADSSARLSNERVWIIDPLDGTREYSQGRADWAVHVALAIGGQPALAAVALPAQQRLLWGVCQDGARLSGLEGAGRLVAAEEAGPAQPRIAVSRSHTPSWMPALAAEFGAQLVPCGSVGAKVALLVLGDADLYAHRKGLKEWDTCAPEVLARALGWFVSRLDGTPVPYNQPNPNHDEFLVCRPADTKKMLAALQGAGALRR
ncbi:MAG: 3'(2'),5'-bisphosphate nucleotidase CysQ [Planctomycetes bacterium]|nr:3'(2'),5'-bisphosphate nucleotidase CysQ [Planctomycetota bacterium]